MRNKITLTVLLIQAPIFYYCSWILMLMNKYLEAACLALMATACLFGVERLIELGTKKRTKDLIKGYQRINRDRKLRTTKRANDAQRRKRVQV